MDLSKLDAIIDADSFDFPLLNPETNAPLMTLVLAGPTHPNMLAFKRANEKRLSQATKRSRDINKALTSVFTETLDDDEVGLAREMERLTLATLDWRGVENNGQSMPFDKATMEKLYRAKTWLRNVVGAELNRSENFTKSSASNS